MNWNELVARDRAELLEASVAELDAWIARHAEPTAEEVAAARHALRAAGVDYWHRRAREALAALRDVETRGGLVLSLAWDAPTRRYAIIDGKAHIVGMGVLADADRAAPAGCSEARFAQRIVSMALWIAAEVGRARGAALFVRLEVPTRRLPYDAIAIEAHRLGQPYRLVTPPEDEAFEYVPGAAHAYLARAWDEQVRLRDGVAIIKESLDLRQRTRL